MTNSLKDFRSICSKIIGIGRNYGARATEAGNDVAKQTVLFMKPPSAFLVEPNDIKIPSEWDEINYEVELGVVIGQRCQRVNPEDVDQYIAGYCLTLDMTAKKLLIELQKEGKPWLLGKGFDNSCPCGDFIDKSQVDINASVNLWLDVNGERRQDAQTRDMLFNIPTLIAYISKFITLERGDLVLTGTPPGVGPVRRGDFIEAGMIAQPNFEYSMKFRVA